MSKMTQEQIDALEVNDELGGDAVSDEAMEAAMEAEIQAAATAPSPNPNQDPNQDPVVDGGEVELPTNEDGELRLDTSNIPPEPPVAEVKKEQKAGVKVNINKPRSTISPVKAKPGVGMRTISQTELELRRGRELVEEKTRLREQAMAAKGR